MNETKELKKTAYHEAGHAVACYFLRIRFTNVTIVPEDNCLGCLKHSKDHHKNFNPEWDNSRKVGDRIEKEVIVRFAGQIAEGLFMGKHIRKGSEHDRSSAIDLALYGVGEGEVLQTYINYLWARAKEQVRQPRFWAAVKALAAELLVRKKIGYRKAREIIERAEEEYIQSKRKGVYQVDPVTLDPEELIGYRIDNSIPICTKCLKESEMTKIKREKHLIKRRNLKKDGTILCARCKAELCRWY